MDVLLCANGWETMQTRSRKMCGFHINHASGRDYQKGIGTIGGIRELKNRVHVFPGSCDASVWLDNGRGR